jgi:hypothetical protein
MYALNRESRECRQIHVSSVAVRCQGITDLDFSIGPEQSFALEKKRELLFMIDNKRTPARSISVTLKAAYVQRAPHRRSEAPITQVEFQGEELSKSANELRGKGRRAKAAMEALLAVSHSIHREGLVG